MSNTTVAGAIRAVLLAADPTLSVFRKEAPVGSTIPLITVSDPFATVSTELGDEVVLEEQVQIDLFVDWGQELTTLPDFIHRTLHRATLDVQGSQVYRCTITDRAVDIAAEGNEDGVDRITFTALIRRLL